MFPDSLFTSLARTINRGIDESTTAAGLCHALEGRSLAVNVSGTGLRLHLTATGGYIDISQNETQAADAELKGTPVALGRLVSTDPQTPIREGLVEMNGDTEVAEQFSELLQRVRPDLEEQLSRIVGDTAAHQIGNAVRGMTEWAADAKTTFERSLSEYLQEESRDLPTRAETDEFLTSVDRLSNDMARLEARVNRLKSACREKHAQGNDS